MNDFISLLVRNTTSLDAPKTLGTGRFLAGVLACLVAGSAIAQAPTGLNTNFEDNSQPWQESAIQLPAAPNKADLLDFDVGGTTTMRFAVDAKSLSVGNDGVVRYTLVSRSASGAENVSYEGIRCESYEKKLYAFGQKDGSWSRSRRDKWDAITGTAANRQHAVLAKEYFCRHKIVEGNAKQIIDRIRYNQPLIGEPAR
ncbi:CNP1-like family protein [Paucimonas lemoignei]|uniref:CNP1-like family protein n=1 Tax=Paucimonas lemoignei TaxID=29443 RepID=A0A4V2UIP7_PAULE|nr:CNP1-like family protein [Paucimonas lemoignei]TCS36900.1 CNP1-like family protein [Paucimonas lemoignei]